jgi:hypothetical protein
MFWDYLSQNAESVHQLLILFGERGTPKGYRHIVRRPSCIPFVQPGELVLTRCSSTTTTSSEWILGPYLQDGQR